MDVITYSFPYSDVGLAKLYQWYQSGVPTTNQYSSMIENLKDW